MKGFDISSYQGGINFDNLKNKVDFLILRAGYTGWGTGTDYNKDFYFEDFYQKAKARNIPVGAYWYSCANTYDKGVAEANYMYENCLKGKQFEFPIYIDVEEERHQTVGKTFVTSAIRGFCETLEKLGYYVGIYANLNFFNNYINTPALYMYDKWFAYWKDDLNKPSFPYGDYGMWQNGTNGDSGDMQNIDTDISYLDYPTIIKNANLNGFNENNIIVNELDKYSDLELAKMTYDGKYGNGEERILQLGDRYNNVQNLINIAIDVIDGAYGNGEERYIAISQTGYNYNDVQQLVNYIMGE